MWVFFGVFDVRDAGLLRRSRVSQYFPVGDYRWIVRFAFFFCEVCEYMLRTPMSISICAAVGPDEGSWNASKISSGTRIHPKRSSRTRAVYGPVLFFCQSSKAWACKSGLVPRLLKGQVNIELIGRLYFWLTHSSQGPISIGCVSPKDTLFNEG